MYAVVGTNGSYPDEGIFKGTRLWTALLTNAVGLPGREALPGDNHLVPYFIVGNNTFPMREWLHTEDYNNYNFRLTRAKRNVENAFGMWANRF